MTNQEFGDLVGVDHSMASRLRNGKRLPSLATLRRIHAVLGIGWTTLLTAYDGGPQAFGAMLRREEEATSRTRKMASAG